MGREWPDECDVAEGLGDSTFLFPLSRSFLFSLVLSSIFKLKALLEDRKYQVKRLQKLGSLTITYPARLAMLALIRHGLYITNTVIPEYNPYGILRLFRLRISTEVSRNQVSV
jgi:hypothetical protein